jgi:hypothetical protein
LNQKLEALRAPEKMEGYIMAKRLVKWSLDINQEAKTAQLKLAKALEDPKAIAIVEAEFPLTKLFPDFITYTETQQQIIVYGIKQKLMDVGAGDIGDGMTKIQSAKKKWQELLENKWTGERVNGTGASENKKLLATAREKAQVVDLQGLLIKKTLFPNTFTEDDETKLQELLREAAKATEHLGKQK